MLKRILLFVPCLVLAAPTFAEEPPLPPADAGTAPATEPPAELSPREVILSRTVECETLGLKLALPPGWATSKTPLGYERLRAQGPIEFSIQPTLSLWIVANQSTPAEFKAAFIEFLKKSYPDFRIIATEETAVAGLSATMLRLEGELAGEPAIRVRAQFAFTLMDMRNHKLIAFLIWPKEKAEYYQRLYAGILASITYTPPVIFKRQDGIVEIGDYICKPLPDWSLRYETSRSDATGQTSEYIVLVPPTGGASLRYRLARESKPLSPAAHASNLASMRQADTTVKARTDERIHDNLHKLRFELELADGRAYELVYVSGIPGDLLVVSVLVTAQAWDEYGTRADQMGRTFALRTIGYTAAK